MRESTRSLVLLLALMVAALCAHAASPEQLQQIEAAQHDFVNNNGGSFDEQLQIENSIAAGAGNLVLIDQIEGTGQHANVEQGGSGNVATVLQGFGDANSADVQQIGVNNEALMMQAGVANAVTMLQQLGGFNQATINQQGQANLAAVTQLNDANKLTLNQKDGYNQADVTQNGNTDLTITQTNAGGSASTTNQLLVKAWAESSASSSFAPIALDGAGSTQLYLCNGSTAYCTSVLP